MARQRAEREALKAGNVDSSLASKAAAGGAKSQAGAAANYINSGVNAGARGTKRSRESIVEEEEYKNRPEIKIVIPDSLKVKLVDDWEAITKNSQVRRSLSLVRPSSCVPVTWPRGGLPASPMAETGHTPNLAAHPSPSHTKRIRHSHRLRRILRLLLLLVLERAICSPDDRGLFGPQALL